MKVLTFKFLGKFVWHMDICTIWHIWDLCYKITPMEWYFLPFRSCWYYLLDFWQLWMVLQSKYKILTLLRIKVWRTNCFPPVFEFWTTAEVVNNVVKGAKIQISLNVYAQKCGSKQIRNFAPFSTSLPTSAEECQKFKISRRHFEIENVSIGA